MSRREAKKIGSSHQAIRELCDIVDHRKEKIEDHSQNNAKKSKSMTRDDF